MTYPNNTFAEVWLAASVKRRTSRQHGIDIPTSHQSQTQTVGDFKGSSCGPRGASSSPRSLLAHGQRPFELPSQLRPSFSLLCVPADDRSCPATLELTQPGPTRLLLRLRCGNKTGQ
ncbi:unnamed protein product [Pleuronectes platessa]|uniref:Uncharacterized protein n=1 Tax=Pleuronectes platessa TaxID=8262 RepID=A0A9N7UGA9_PLEPL|nr:unnamed protein product [Pleuronectes platessa]